MKIIIAIFGLMTSLTVHAESDTISGNFYYELCQSNYQACAFYATGIYNGIEMSIALLKHLTTTEQALAVAGICSHGSVTTGQLTDVWIKYLKEHPEERNAPGGGIAMLSWQEAWPCSKKPLTN